MIYLIYQRTGGCFNYENLDSSNYYPTLNDIRKNYPVLNEYELDEKQDKCRNIRPYIRINSLRQLVNLSLDLHQMLIIDAEGYEPAIEIYDAWRES